MSTFVGTQAAWESLDMRQKIEYDTAIMTDVNPSNLSGISKVYMLNAADRESYLEGKLTDIAFNNGDMVVDPETKEMFVVMDSEYIRVENMEDGYIEPVKIKPAICKNCAGTYTGNRCEYCGTWYV